MANKWWVTNERVVCPNGCGDKLKCHPMYGKLLCETCNQYYEKEETRNGKLKVIVI